MIKTLQRLVLVGVVAGLFSLYAPVAHAVNYGNGVYTNLCGTGFAASADTCNHGCNTSTGSCSIASPYVVKWTCNGRLNECRNNESSWSTSHSLSGTSCGKTVQIDVFTHNCRNGGQATWSCGDSHLKDYLVWYSGDCPHSNSTPTPQPNRSSCDQLTVTTGDNAIVPATVTLRARGSDNQGSIQQYRFYFGDGNQTETANAETTHRYETSGSFRARADVKDSKGTWKTSGSCETTVNVRALPVESHKSDCSDLYIKEGNYTNPPTTVKFQVTGYDNKGAIGNYKIDNGTGSSQESASGIFERIYDTSGTYTIKGYILDSGKNWKGGSGSCQKTLYINTKPLTSQPKTGTPTLYTLLSMVSGVIGIGLLGYALRK